MNQHMAPVVNSFATDVVIVGTGAAGLFLALQLPPSLQITMICKRKIEESDSFLAQGGICVLKDEADYSSYYEDTMRAGHYENNPAAVELMIHSSGDIIQSLLSYGVDFEKENGSFLYTKEGGHSANRILFHKDITGYEITSKLLARVRESKNITILPNSTMIDIIERNSQCKGVVALNMDKSLVSFTASYTVLACGGLGGLYKHSTNFHHITGDALAIALKHNIELEHIDYIQIHPTTLYSEKEGRRFLISESVRGEGAILLNANMERFVDELLPRDIVAEKIYEQMEKDGKPYVWLSMQPIPEEEIKGHFPNIYKECLEAGYDVTKECIPVVPAQHYFMGGIKVDLDSQTSMKNLYAVGETSCNGVHGANRLASNSLLESLVFARQAAKHIAMQLAANAAAPPETSSKEETVPFDTSAYCDLQALSKEYRQMILHAIQKEHESHPDHILVRLPEV